MCCQMSGSAHFPFRNEPPAYSALLAPAGETEMQFKIAIDAFIQFCVVERRLSPHTSTAYRFDLADFEKWAQGGPEDITTASLKSYMEDMASRQLSTATIRRRLACLRAFFHYTCEHTTLQNPFDGWRLRLPPRQTVRRAVFPG